MTPATAQQLKHLTDELVNSTRASCLTVGPRYIHALRKVDTDRIALHSAIDALVVNAYQD